MSESKLPGPAEARAALLLDRLGRGRALYRDFTWPGGTLACRLRVHTNSERQLATAAAVRRFVDLGLAKDDAGQIELPAAVGDDFLNEVINQLLWLILEDPTRPIPGDPLGRCERIFESPDQFRDLTTETQRDSVWFVYQDVEMAADPEQTLMTQAELNAVLRLIKKKDASLLRGLGPSTLLRYALTTGPLLEISQTSKSESSSSSSPSTSDSESDG